MDLLVPERHSILVRFHESGDDAAVTVQRVRWIATDAEGRPYGKLYPSRAASGQIAYELDSRSSRILLNITDPVYALVERDHVYDLAGTQSINVEVMRSARIVLSCVSNSMIVPMNAEWWDRVCVVDSAGNDRTIGREMVSEDRECVLQVMGGGTFGLRCAEVVGFDVRGPSLVECSVGNVMRYEIELSPK
jgi:hypothetical protein